jgi:hypothetical protein
MKSRRLINLTDAEPTLYHIEAKGFASQQTGPDDVGDGSISDIARPPDVCFAPHSGLRAVIVGEVVRFIQ